MKLSKGIQFFAGSTQTTYDLTNLNLSAGNYAITVIAEAEGFTDSDVSNSVNYTVQAQLATPTIAMNADGKTLEITDVENATSYDVYVDGTLKTNVMAPYIGKFTTYTSGESGVGKPVILSYEDKEYILTPAAPYEVLEQQLAVKPGDKITWSVNSGSITVINNVNCTVTGTYTQHGFAQPTSNNWQLSTSFSV